MRKISAPAILLLGDPGAGKTFSLATLAARCEKLFYLYTDPGGDESLLDALEHYKVSVKKIHWHYVEPSAGSWESLEELAKKVNTMSYGDIATIKNGIDKRNHRQYFTIVEQMAGFECERTGQKFPGAEHWDPNWGFAFDSLSGLNNIAQDVSVGAKPTLHEGEWNIAMKMEEQLIRKTVASLRGPKVFIGHLNKVTNPVTGIKEISVALLGQKLAPKIPSLFSDVVLAKRVGSEFIWSTMEDGATLKTRNLPLAEKIKPDFTPILDKWEHRKAQVLAGEEVETTDEPEVDMEKSLLEDEPQKR